MAIEPEATHRVKQPAPERALEQGQAHQCLVQGNFRCAASQCGPASLYLPHPFNHDGVVLPVRPTVERQAHAHGGRIAGGEQQTIAAEIVEAEVLAANCIEKVAEAAAAQQLPRQYVVTLQSRIIVRQIPAVDCTK